MPPYHIPCLNAAAYAWPLFVVGVVVVDAAATLNTDVAYFVPRVCFSGSLAFVFIFIFFCFYV